MAKPTPAPTRRAAPAAAARPAARTAAAPARRAAAAPADDDFGDFDSFEDEAPATPARGRGKAAPAPVDEDFGDFDAPDGDAGDEAGDTDFDSFEDEAPAPARGRGKAAAAAPADDDFDDFDGVDGEASDDEGSADFTEDGEGEGDFADAEGEGEEPVEEEPVVLQPKLRNGEYILPKGAKAWYIGDDGEGGWKRARDVVDTTRALKLVFSKKDHNYPFGLEDSNGKTWVALGYGKGYIICTTAEQLLDAKTKKPAKILAAAPAEEAPAPARGRGKAAAAPVDEAPAMSREQVIAVKKFDAAVAELKAAFGIG